MISNESHLGLLRLLFSNEENKIGRLHTYLFNPENVGGLTLSFCDERPYNNNNFQRVVYSMQGDSIFNKPITPEDCANPLLAPRGISITASGDNYISSTLGNLIPSLIQKERGYSMAFSYYPDSQNATLDGTGSKFNDLSDAGFFSTDKQQCLWGDLEKNINDFGVCEISSFAEGDFDLLRDFNDVNSIRVYSIEPDSDYLGDVEMVIYPRKVLVLDAMDLASRIRHWVENTEKTMGNWVSREVVLQNLNDIDFEEVPVYSQIPVDELNKMLQENGKVIAVGFDVLQVPGCKVSFEKK